MRVVLSTAALLWTSFWAHGTGVRVHANEPAKASSLGFRHDIVPLLHRHGCSSAYCHGSATGRGGFKLSLFGTDPEADHHAIVEELDGRRLDHVDPSESLLLRKASKATSHGGGLRLPERHSGFRAIQSWIARGAPLESSEARRLEGLEIERQGDRVRAFATFIRGVVKERHDVSERTVFESSNPEVVHVDEDGRVEISGDGEAWIFAHYSQEHARHPIVAPFSERKRAPRNSDRATMALDAAWRRRLDELGLEPAASAPQTTVARRLYLDLAGRPPSPRELARFLALPEDTRVEKTARKLVDSRDFSTTFAAHLAQWLEIPAAKNQRNFNVDRNARLREWLLELVRADRPLREIVDSTLDSNGRGASLLSRHSDPRDRSEFVGRAFLGTRIGCARCHNHPLDRWTQEDHLAFSAFFANPRPNPEGGMSEGLLFHPKTGDIVAPRLLPADLKVPVSEKLARRERLSRFLFDRGHDLFARSIANRVFQTFLGSGLVEPVDDHRLSNPASHEPLLDALAEIFAGSDTRLRPLVLAIVSSKIYALSSDPASTRSFPDSAEVRFLARRESRSLDALRFERAVRYVVGVPPLPSAFQGSSLSDAPLAKQLATLNGPLLHSSLNAGQTNVDAVFDFRGDARDQLRDLWLTILARPPRPEELNAFASVLENSENRTIAGRDIAFALLASREFGSIR